MVVYKFLYCSCIYESSFATVSIHKSKKGAYKAMRKFILDEYTSWYDNRIKYGKFKCLGISKFGESQAWYVEQQKLEE